MPQDSGAGHRVRILRSNQSSRGRLLRSPAWAALLGGGLALRLIAIDNRGLWGDEAWRVWAARLPSMSDVLHVAWAQPPSAPLYWLGLHLWIAAFGHGDIAVRLFSVLPSVACIAAIYWLGLRLGGTCVGWIAAVLLAVSPMAVEVGQEATMYAWSMLAATMTLAAGVSWLQTGDGRARYVAFGAILLYLHYLGPLVLAWFFLAGLLAVRNPDRIGIIPAVRLRAWLGGHVLLAVIWLPWAVPMLLRIAERWPELRQLRHAVSLAELHAVAGHLAFSASPQAFWPPLWSAAALGGCGTVLVWSLWRNPRPAAAWLCLFIGLGTIGTLLGVSAVTGAWLFQPRFLALSLPLVLCALALGMAPHLAGLGKHTVAAGLAAVWICVQAAGLLAFYERPVHGRDGLREIGAWLTRNVMPTDVVVGNHPYLLWSVAQYFPGKLHGLPSDWDVRRGYPLLPPSRPAWVASQLAVLPEIAGQAPRLWLIYLPVADPEGKLLTSIQRTYRLVTSQDYPLVGIYLFARKMP